MINTDRNSFAALKGNTTETTFPPATSHTKPTGHVNACRTQGTTQIRHTNKNRELDCFQHDELQL